MKTAIVIKIDDDSLRAAGLSAKEILDISLEALTYEYDYFDLDYDCGYDPGMITNETPN